MKQANAIVVIEHSELHSKSGGHPVHKGIYVLKKLRDAGIPATGILYVEGIENGRLTLECDADAKRDVWRWEGWLPSSPIYSDDDDI